MTNATENIDVHYATAGTWDGEISLRVTLIDSCRCRAFSQTVKLTNILNIALEAAERLKIKKAVMK